MNSRVRRVADVGCCLENLCCGVCNCYLLVVALIFVPVEKVA